METVNEPTYLGDRSSAVGECEAAVTATATGEVCLGSVMSCCLEDL